MSSIKLKHSGGNSVIIAAPDSNPASDRTLKLPSDADGTILTTTNPKAGNIIQVVQTTKTDTFTTTSTSFTDITGMSVSITPSSTSNKILISVDINYGGGNFNFYCNLLRGSTILNAPSSGNNPCTVSLCGITNTTYQILNSSIFFLDSPSTTSSTTYKLQIDCQGDEFFLNRSKRNGSADSVCSSTISAMEVAA